MKPSSEIERFLRYQRVLDALFKLDAFHKEDAYKAAPDEERVFVGRLIGELERDGHLVRERARCHGRFGRAPPLAFSECPHPYNYWICWHVFWQEK